MTYVNPKTDGTAVLYVRPCDVVKIANQCTRYSVIRQSKSEQPARKVLKGWFAYRYVT